MSKKKKLQVFLLDDQLQNLDALVEKGGFRTRADLVDNAITLLDWCINKAADGYTIAAIDNDDDGDISVSVSVTMPAFMRVRMKANGPRSITQTA